MKRMIILLSMACSAALTGCTSIVRPHVSEAEFLTPVTKIAGSAELYVTEDFRTHKETKTDVLDFKKWQFDLGPLAVDAFKYALGSRLEKIEVKLGTPSFPLTGSNAENLFIVVEPSFAGFSSHCPFLFKFETYVVKV